MNPNKKTSNCLVYGLVALPVICCLAILGYLQFEKITIRNCYEQLAEEMHVDPTFWAIHTEFYERAQAVVEVGMPRDEVLAAREQIAPVYIGNQDSLLDGGIVDETFLQICPFPVADVMLLVYYSPGDTLEEVRLYFDD